MEVFLLRNKYGCLFTGTGRFIYDSADLILSVVSVGCCCFFKLCGFRSSNDKFLDSLSSVLFKNWRLSVNCKEFRLNVMFFSIVFKMQLICLFTLCCLTATFGFHDEMAVVTS